MADTVSFLMVERTSLFDMANFAAKFFTDSEWVTSVPQLCRRLTWMRGGKLISNLFIQGHGVPGFQSVGAGSGGVDDTGLVSIGLTDKGELHATTAAHLRSLRGFFAPGAIVTLGGCQVAAMTNIPAADVSREQLKQDAKAAGMTLQQWTNEYRYAKVPGTRLLKGVSDALGGVPVQAGTDNQTYLIPGMSGTVWRCTPESRRNMGSNWWNVP